MSLRSDCFLAVAGVIPKGIDAKDHAAADALPARWVRRLRAWLTADQAPFSYVEPRDMERLFDKVAADPAEAEVRAWLAPIVDDDDLTVNYYPALIEARHYLVQAWPRLVVTGPAGPYVLPLATDDVAEIWSLFQVVNAPDRVLEEMDARTLTPSQAAAFRACYPALAELAHQTLQDAMGERRGRDMDWMPDAEHEAVMRTLLGLPPEVPFVPPPSPAAAAPSKLKLDPAREQTQAQASAAPKPAK